MNARVSANGRTKAGEILKAVGVAALLMVGAPSAFAAGSYGGGSHGGGFHGGGFGGAHMSGGHFSAPHYGASRGFGGGHFSTAPHYYGPSIHAGIRAGGIHGGLGAAGHGYRPGWGGGYWRGGYWPRAYYGWSYPFFLGVLPALCTTYWWGDVPYYYVNDVYYTWNAADNGYEATDPPPVSDGNPDAGGAAAAAGQDAVNALDATPPDVAPPAPATDLIAYPRNGQSDQQQATDKFQCHSWAKGQTGFDPTSQSSSGASANVRSAYGRAMAACLDGRGYSVR